MTWLLNNMEATINSNVVFLSIAKEMWDALSKMYSYYKNVSRVYEFYGKMFNLRQGGRLINEYYVNLKGAMDELVIYYHMTTDA